MVVRPQGKLDHIPIPKPERGGITIRSENVLGIDFGPEHVGLALVRREPAGEQVLYAASITLRDLSPVMKERRALRRQRRSESWYRQPRVPQRGGGSARGAGAQEDEQAVEGVPEEEEDRSRARSAPEYRRAQGCNKPKRKCKYVDPKTGEVCGANTPRKEKVRDLLLWDICQHLPVEPEQRLAILSYVNQVNIVRPEVLACLALEERALLENHRALARASKSKPLPQLLCELKIKKQLQSQILAIASGDPERKAADLKGRMPFCRKHFLLHHEQTRIPKPSAWLPPSIRCRHADLERVCREEVAPRWPVHRIRLERAQFDLQAIQRDPQGRGKDWDPEEWQRGPCWGRRNIYSAKRHEQGNRCAYCGKNPKKENRLELEHVKPGGGNTWDNLVLACRKCNQRKGKADAPGAGLEFSVDPDTGVSLAPRGLGESVVARYMTQTDQGYRELVARLQQLFPDAQIEYRYGYQTDHIRKRWIGSAQFAETALSLGYKQSPPRPKKRRKQWTELAHLKRKPRRHSDPLKSHVMDAVAIASALELDSPPQLCPAEKIILRPSRRQLFDTNPLQRGSDDKFYQRVKICGTQGGLAFDKLKHVVDDSKRAILERVRDRLIEQAKVIEQPKGNKESPPSAFTPDAAQLIPFTSVRLAKRDASKTNTRRLKGGHWYKVAGGPNWATVVYRLGVREQVIVIRNPAVFPDDSAELPKGAQVLFSFRKGELVSFEQDGQTTRARITKNNSNGTLTVERLDDGREVTRSARCFRPVPLLAPNA